MSALSPKVATGAVWMVGLRLIDRGIGFVSTLILARLLVPEDFGVVAMAMAVFAFVEMGGMFGFDLALIRQRDAERGHYDSAWTLQVGYGVFTALAMAALAWPAAALFAEPRLVPVLLVLGFVAALQGLENIGIVDFRRELNFAKDFQLMFARKAVAFVVTVALAYHLRSYWALLAGTAASRVTGVILSYAMHAFRPRLATSHVRPLLRFSRWIVARSFVDYAIDRGADFVIGRQLGAGALGLYRVSREIATLPTSELIHPIMRAVFPGYATVLHDRQALARAFLSVQGIVVMLTLPAGLGIVLLAEPLVALLLGARWSAAVPIVQILGLYGAVSVFQATNLSIFNVLGVPHWGVAVRLVEAVTLFVLIMAFLAWQPGLVGVAWAAFFAQALAIPVGVAMIGRLLPVSFGQRAAVAWRPVVASGAMCAALFALAPALPGSAGAANAAVHLVLGIAAGAATFAAAVGALWWASGRPDGAERRMFVWLQAKLISS